MREQALEPGVAKVDVLARLGREVSHLVRVIQADPLGVLGIVLDDVDVAVVQGGRNEGVPHGTGARRHPTESQHLWQVVLEVPPRIAALAVVAIPGEVPVAPVECPVEARAHDLRGTLPAEEGPRHAARRLRTAAGPRRAHPSDADRRRTGTSRAGGADRAPAPPGCRRPPRPEAAGGGGARAGRGRLLRHAMPARQHWRHGRHPHGVHGGAGDRTAGGELRRLGCSGAGARRRDRSARAAGRSGGPGRRHRPAGR